MGGEVVKTHQGLMNRVGLLLTLAFLFSVLTQTVRADYCIASGGCGEYISDVQVGDINNTDTGCDSYADYTSLSTTMEIGTDYSITVVNGDNWLWEETCAIWVDWNQDGDFYDSDEEIIVGGGPKTFTATITPPVDASLGDTHMRIRIRHSGDPEPCGETTYGKVEDYTINVTDETLKVSGHVTLSDGSPLSGVLLEAYYGITTPSGLTDISDANGYYEIILDSPWTGHIKPSKGGWDFLESMLFTDVTTDQTEDLTAYWPYSGGSGTSPSPYEIMTPEDMHEIGNHPETWDKHFKLMADIDLGVYTGDSFNIIGNYLEPFAGAFDGNGKKITNFTYSTSSEYNIGIFGYVDGPNIEIKDLVLVDVQIDAGNSNSAGALIGWNLDATVTNCSSSGNITGRHWVGGLVGCSAEILTNCHSTANVFGTLNKIGGLVGGNGGTILNCFSLGDVTGGIYVGGLVGENDGTISKCYTMSGVFGTGENTGGFVGINDWGGNISNCYSMSNVSGSFSSNDNVGGFAGENGMSGEILNCYSAGQVSANTSSTGGLVGLNYNTIADSFWDRPASSQLYSAGGTGKSTEQMQMESTFTDAGWDFNTPIWQICDGTNYPKLAWQIPLPGDFVCPDGVEINDLAVLVEQWLLEKLSADISPNGGDGFVNSVDWAVFANAWQSTSDPLSANWNPKCDIAPDGGDGTINIDDLTVFVSQWLQLSAYCADIAPEPDGDGVVNMLDFAKFAGQGLK
jgi:hypothetical protein